MSIDKSRLRKLTAKWKPMGLEDKMTFGRYKNCRLSFIIKMNPRYLEELLKHNGVDVDKEVRRKLYNKIQELEWGNYLLK